MTFASGIRSIASVSISNTHRHVEAGPLKQVCHVASGGRVMKTCRPDDARDGRTSTNHERSQSPNPRSR